MSKKQDLNLNADEKNEIKNDVKDAFGKAFSKPMSSIEKILNEGPKDTLNQEEVDKIVNKQNKKKDTDKRPVIITIILIILIAIAGIYMYFSNNPKTIFIKAIDKTFNTLEKNITPKYEKTTGELTLNLENNSPNQANLKLDMDYGIDSKDSLFSADMKISSNNEKLLDIKMYGENDKTYLYSESILNKYLEFDANINNKEEIKTILNSLNKAITKSIENEKYNGSKTQIDINGKTTKTYKSSFTLDKNNIEIVLNNINDNLTKDEKFIEAVSKITNKTKDEVNQLITEKIEEIKTGLANTENLTFNVYTKGPAQEFVKLEINKTINKETSTISITNIGDGKYQSRIDNKQTKQKATGDIEYKNSPNELYLKIKINGDANLDLTLTNKYQKAKDIELMDTSETVKISDLSDEEKANIITKIFFNS